MPAEALLPIVVTMLGSSILSGIVSGLLGVGGGIVLVPVLELALGFAGVPPDWRMHVAVATSCATIIPTSISSTRAHNLRGAVDWGLARDWAPGILLGALAGSLLASQAPHQWLTTTFGVVSACVALRMLLARDRPERPESVPRGIAGNLLAAGIGAISATMGIGGGAIAVAVMTTFGFRVHRAVGTAAFLGLLISVPATIGYLLAKPGVALPWSNVGLVSLIGAALIVPGAMLTAPLGARIAHGISRRALSRTFGVFLLCIAGRMLYRALAES